MLTGLGLPPLAERRVDAEPAEILVRPVADLVLGQPLDRMLQRVDAAVGGDRAEFADRRVDRLGVALEIGEIADRHLAQHHALADRGVAAELAAFQLRGRMDARLGSFRRRFGRSMRADLRRPAQLPCKPVRVSPIAACRWSTSRSGRRAARW